MNDGFHAIRKAAGNVLAEYEQQVGQAVFENEGASHRLLNDIAKKVFRLTVTRDDDLPDGALGQLDLKARVIGYSPNLTTKERIYTVAHEIGHRALEHPDGPFFERRGDVDDAPDHSALSTRDGVFRGYSPKSRYELEANVFAAELLAPVALVRGIIRGSSPWTVESLAERFGLSKTAMLNQMTAAMLPLPDEELMPERPLQEPIPDPSHTEAIDVKTPALIEAGPGSGKTRVLVERYERLVREGADPRRILTLTYSNKAAAEMRERISRKLPEHTAKIQVTTFHSFGLDLIRQYRKILGYAKDPRPLQVADTLSLLRKHLATMPLGRFESLSAPASRLGFLIDAISRAKDELVEPAELENIARTWQAEVLLEPWPTKSTDIKKAESRIEHAAKCVDAAIFYAAYEEVLKASNALDFGDLIAKAVHLVEKTGAGIEIRAEFDHILVDEFQDINYASGKLIHALDGGRGIVWAVGDVRQSIYRFRGADPTNLTRFVQDYKGAHTVSLGRNYRSVTDVVECGALVPMNGILTPDEAKDLRVDAYRGRPSLDPAVKLIVEQDRDGEYNAIRSVIEEERNKGTLERDIAILCRSRADAQSLSDFLENAGFPTSWPGDPMASEAVKNVLAILLLAAGDTRGLERAAALRDHPISRSDLVTLLKWRYDQRSGVYALLKAAKSGEISEISEATKESCAAILGVIGNLASMRMAFTAVASYVFENGKWCRDLLTEDAPTSGRDLAALRQLLLLSRASAEGSDDAVEKPIQAFIGFIETAVQSGKLDVVTADLGNPRLINLMTVHASKGLEWPVVIVPFLVDGKFPLRVNGEKTPVPPTLPRGGVQDTREAEEACLFFVATTRARDRLILTRAQFYGSTKKKPSYWLESVVAGLVERGFITIEAVPETEATRKEKAVLALEPDGRVYAYSELSAYNRCPKRFEYDHVLHLSGGDRGYFDFHRAVGDTVRWFREELTRGDAPSLDGVLTKLSSRWEGTGLGDHFYGPRFRELAEKAVSSQVERITGASEVEFDKEILVDAGGVLVRFAIEEYEAGPPVVMRRMHLTGPKSDHLGKGKDDRPALLAMFADANGNGSWLIEEHYPSYGTIKASHVTKGMKGTLIGNRREDMKRFAIGLRSGIYVPKPEDFKCKRCPFSIVCPKKVVGDEEVEG